MEACLNCLKKMPLLKKDYKSISNIVKAHYEEFLNNNGINNSVKRAGVSFPEICINSQDIFKV